MAVNITQPLFANQATEALFNDYKGHNIYNTNTTQASMLKDLHVKAPKPIGKHMADSNNIIQSLKEKSDNHTKKKK